MAQATRAVVRAGGGEEFTDVRPLASFEESGVDATAGEAANVAGVMGWRVECLHAHMVG